MMEQSAEKPAAGSCRVIISYYHRRPVADLVALLESMAAHDAGLPFATTIIVNRTGGSEAFTPPEAPFNVEIIERENLGMNIGAWNQGWRERPHDAIYLFLQHDCLVVRDAWLKAYADRLAAPAIGLIGETLNPKWNLPWDEIRRNEGAINLPEHTFDPGIANRIDGYLAFMKARGVAPGVSGRHLRSLTWALRGETLHQIGGFPVGRNFGECIAAEICVNRAVAALGLALEEVGPQPFHFIRHRDWHQDEPGGAYSHRAVQVERITALEAKIVRMREHETHSALELDRLKKKVRNPSWRFIIGLVRRRLGLGRP